MLQGLEEATKAILSTILDKKSFPHLRYEVRPETTKVFEEILTLRKKNVLLVPKHDLDAIFKQNGVPSSTEGMKDDVQFLQDAVSHFDNEFCVRYFGIQGYAFFDFYFLVIRLENILLNFTSRSQTD